MMEKRSERQSWMRRNLCRPRRCARWRWAPHIGSPVLARVLYACVGARAAVKLRVGLSIRGRRDRPVPTGGLGVEGRVGVDALVIDGELSSEDRLEELSEPLASSASVVKGHQMVALLCDRPTRTHLWQRHPMSTRLVPAATAGGRRQCVASP